MPEKLRIAFAAPQDARDYRAHLLDAADAARAAHNPALHNRAGWRAARVLKQRLAADKDFPPAAVCLTHKRGCAAAIAAAGRRRIGIDLEICTPRDFSALYPWIAAAGETPPDSLTAFYRCWTLKEALLKAENLPFPAGMRQVGAAGGRLFTPSGSLYGGASWIFPAAGAAQMLLSAVWEYRCGGEMQIPAFRQPENILVAQYG